jgi:2-polyprenyl-3-methyl-5-hydroxy-6-metoxy-1,4-benzoquinol methylase
MADPHVAIGQHSPWIARWIGLPLTGARLLDFACGSGRHSRLAADRGFRVLAVDRDEGLLDSVQHRNTEVRAEDLESGRWSFSAERFEVIVVANFLHRPRLPLLAALLAPGGRLVYETFALGNQAYGKPSRPAFLLKPEELFLVARRAGLQVVAFEQGFVASPRSALVQRVAAVRPPWKPESLPLVGHEPTLS